MRRLGTVLVLTLFATLSLAAATDDPALPSGLGVPPVPRVPRQPIVFEQNLGQFGGDVAFAARTPGGDLRISTGGALSIDGESVRLAHARATLPRGIDRASAHIHYYSGTDERRWLTDVPAFAAVRMDDVYPGVDWIWRARGGAIEYDFVIAPGSTPNRIALEFGRRTRLRLDGGDLITTTNDHETRHHRPAAYQEIGGTRHPVDARWRIAGRRAAFSLGQYDVSYPVVIDPVLSWSEYLTSSLAAGATAAVAAADGSVYVASAKRVSRFTAAGDLIFSTGFGGSQPLDSAAAIVVDASGRAFVAGETYSSDFTVRNAAQPTSGGAPDGFVSAFAPDGTLVFSTYAGGSSTDLFTSIALGPDGSVWMAGGTYSSNFPSPGGAWTTPIPNTSFFSQPIPNGVVEHLSRDGQIAMASYLAAGWPQRSDLGQWIALGLAVASDGAVYVAPGRVSLPWVDPIHGATPDLTPLMSIMRIDPTNGAFVWERNPGFGRVLALAASADGGVWAVGNAIRHRSTTSFILQPTADAYDSSCGTDGLCNGVNSSDGFLLGLDASGNTAYATFLGGAGVDGVNSVKLSPAGSLWLTGQTFSSDWPDVRTATDAEAFVARFSLATHRFTYVSRIGGSADDAGIQVAPNAQDGAFLIGTTRSSDLPARRNGLSDATTFLAYFPSLANLLTIDRPTNGATVATDFNIGGWGIDDRLLSGAGLDAIHVWAFPITPAGPARFVGAAQYGTARPDIAALYGDRYAASGYMLDASLPPGTYIIGVYGHSAATQSFDVVRTITITVAAPQPNPLIFVDTPIPGQVVTSAFEVGGWAVDMGASTGTGVDAVQFYVQPPGASAPGVFMGTGSYGWTRNDVGAILGSRFANSGYHFTISGLSSGSFTLNVFAHSTVTHSYSIVRSVPIEVSATSLMSIDTPAAEATITASSFLVGGWAIDRSFVMPPRSDSGVDMLHVYAEPNPGSGQPAVFLGSATVGISRPDVGAAYGGRYNDSGYELIVDRAALGLPPGVYNIIVNAHSSVTGTFNNIALVRVTLQ